MALSQAASAQQHAASHEAKGSILHRQATFIDQQGKIMVSMYEEQQNMLQRFAQLEQKYIKQL